MAHNGHAFQIPGHTDQAPFPADRVLASQQELTKTHHRFNDAEHRLHRLFTQGVEAAPRFSLELVRHALLSKRPAAPPLLRQ